MQDPRHEAHVSTFENAPQAYSRLSRTYEDQGRARCYQRTPSEGPRATCSLTQRRAGRRTHVLRSGADFEAVLRSGLRLASRNFVLRARANAVGMPRLGIIAGRRAASRAVDRNRGKRLIREAFRSARAGIGPYDVTIQLRSDLRKDLSSAVRIELLELLDALVRRSDSRQPVTPNGQ